VISAVVAPPAAAAPIHFEELRALVRGADDALTALNRTVREIERLVGQWEKPSTLSSVASADASSSFSVAVAAPPVSPAAARDAGPTAAVPWDGERHRRRIALAITLSLLLGFSLLLVAMACSHGG
jgi:hypothetical protein